MRNGSRGSVVVMKISLFVDVADPWSYIATTRVERAAGTFTLVAHEPMELLYRAFPGPRRDDSGTPLADAEVPYDINQVRNAAQVSGLELNIDDAVVSDSFDALRLLTWAEAAGTQEMQRELLHELWRAHFLEGADIADHLVLSTRAGVAGYDMDEVDEFLTSDTGIDEVEIQAHTIAHVGFKNAPVIVVENRWVIPQLETQDGYLQALHRIREEIRAEERE